MPRIRVDALTELAARALRQQGATPSMAQAAAEALVEADLEGLPTHGVSRIPFYCAMLRNGRADGRAVPTVLRDSGAVALIDNSDALPFATCAMATTVAVAKARLHGVGIAGITRSGHTGAHAINLLPVAAAGLVGFSCSNAPAAIPPWGGSKPLFGTNPLCAVFPRENSDPLIIDLSLTTVTRGKIMLAAQKGEKIPDGWALDRDGNPTNDPQAVLNGGSLYAIGGMKGAMLAMMIELLCCALTGSALSLEVDSYFTEQGNRPRVGQLFIVIDPGRLAGMAAYFERVETLVGYMTAQPGVRLPGARRFAEKRRLHQTGIEVPEYLLNEINQLAS